MPIYANEAAGLDRDAQALARLILGNKHDTAKQERGISAESAAMQQAADLKAQAQRADFDAAKGSLGGLPQGSNVHYGSASIATPKPEDPLLQLLRAREMGTVKLTPAQEAAEKNVGKQIADYEVGGGRAAADKNVRALEEVRQDLANRDMYDRAVGAAFGNWPSILGVVGSTEKARRDKARNTALTLAKQTDPNPTEKQQETIAGQVYDPASSNDDNDARLERFNTEQAAKRAQIEGAAQRYHQTGYGTLGGGQQPARQPQSGGGLSPEKLKRLEELRAKYKR